ncbi:TetR/AcrR family transcriptional regulator [Bacillus suaedaesalsae]|uniref:TetR/AcrR family transcriptional regulator n=1 Tax=Bacillus suaedaesalsae TaxID=2810349 RepID=A0ABS2DJJ2_9BACI|nr:TetR/AcrR family transcriptional regulator [Bacillus suaedaesalsae]MBM6618666.1 TetR/AcrR family transcriptional regulator [Bacillus suaedaesalsae]
MSPKVTEEYKENRKLELLQVAREVFIEKGFESTTMKDIVEKSGLSRGGVYQYFSSTEEMYREIVELGDKKNIKRFEEIIHSDIPIWNTLVEMVEGYRHIDIPNFGTVQFEYSVNGWRNQERLSYILDRSVTWRNMYNELLEEGVKRGEFYPKLPISAIADFLLNVLDGLLLYHCFGGTTIMDIEGQVDSLVFYLEKVLLEK